jgi:2-polyprenyl-6-methoxyphenol hydroxylase-like FAD-dependent oxidoreductase
VRVLEKHGDFLRDFRGDTVHPSTMRLLDGLGLGEQFAALPQSHLRSVAFPVDENQTMVTVGDFSRLTGPHPYIAMVPQWNLLSLLATAAAAEPTFTLMMESEVTGLVREGGRVSGVVYRDRAGVSQVLSAHLVVAADGRTSVARREADLPVHEYACPLDAWWFRLPRRDGDPQGALLPRVGRGRMAILIPREGYFQIAYIGRKGTDAALRARGIEAFRADIADLVPALADRVDTLRSMDDVKWLDVRLNRLRRWSVDGLLCIGDAAHAMSPVGGVGINLAVQDAVAAATLLAEPLRNGAVGRRQLRAVQRRRVVATRLVQGLQRAMHKVLVGPALDGRLDGPPTALLAVLRRVPQVSAVPAYLIGVGFRPEHVPAYARRAPQPVPAPSASEPVPS